MDLFSLTNLKADPAKVKQVKTWISEILNIDEQVAISLNQLTCRETDCPPIETAIVNTETCPCALRRRGLPQSLWNNRQNNTKFISQLLK
jgi:hypothetical protein